MVTFNVRTARQLKKKEDYRVLKNIQNVPDCGTLADKSMVEQNVQMFNVHAY